MKITLGYQVIIAVLAGILAGLFFGPLCTVLKPVGDIFVMLLQMVVLPYISFSLIHGLGSIQPKTALKLLKRGGLFLLMLWVIVFIVIYLLDLILPRPLLAIIGVTEDQGFLSENLLNYLVPENPFYDLANNIVPAVAVFGLIVGLAVMHLEKKEPLLSFLERVNATIETILKWLAIISPVGIFAHIAVAMGTVNFSDLFKLQFYVLSFIVVTFFMTLWVLPVILSSFTPLNYKQIIKEFRNVCMLAFATGVPSIAFPAILRATKKIATKHDLEKRKFHSTSQTIIPLSYSFAQIGNCFILFFIFFLSFYYRHPFLPSEKVLLSVLTIPMSFGASPMQLNAISFLIKHLGFPNQAVTLFSETLAITKNFQVLLSVAGVFTLIVLGLFAYYGLLKIRWKKLFFHLVVTFAVFTAAVLIVRYSSHIDDNYHELYLNLNMAEIIDNPPKVTVFHEPPPEISNAAISNYEKARPLRRILQDGVLRVGYDIRNIPYCYYNIEGDVVGYDIAYAYQLARDLDCRLELYPLSLTNMGRELAGGYYDIAMSAVIMDEHRLMEMDFTNYYDEEDNVLVVPMPLRNHYLNLSHLERRKDFRIGAVGGYRPVVKRHFPLATMVPIDDIASLQEKQVEAIIWSRLPAFVWSLAHADYVAVSYGNLLGKRYFAYPVKTGAYAWISFVNNWLNLKKQSGFEKVQYHYWIEGEAPKSDEPRWSILRNVLHWID